MKKFLALVMAMMMVLAMGTAFADGVEQTDMSSVTLTKVYKLAADDTVSPAESFEFGTLTCTSVTNAGVDPTTGNVVTTATAPVPTIAGTADYAQGKATVNGAEVAVTINLPTYTAIGVYTYTFNETAGTTAGVTYNSDTITLVVTVIEQDGKVRIAAVHTEGKGETKSSKFENTYTAGSLAVTKKVTGQFGDTQKAFNVTVTFTAPAGETVGAPIYYTDDGEEKTIAANWSNNTATASITLKNAETVTFTNIPEGVTYTVTESDYTSEGYDAAQYTYSDATNKKIGGTEKDTVEITNNKGATIDTGMFLDNAPYMMIMGLVVLAGVAMMMKRRAYND